MQMSADGATHDALNLAIVKEGHALDHVYTEGNGDSHDQSSTQVTKHISPYMYHIMKNILPTAESVL
jgi:hypothetical protein